MNDRSDPRRCSGAVAQLVAHHTGSVGVRGSSPLSSTRDDRAVYLRNHGGWPLVVAVPGATARAPDPPGTHRSDSGRRVQVARVSLDPPAHCVMIGMYSLTG